MKLLSSSRWLPLLLLTVLPAGLWAKTDIPPGISKSFGAASIPVGGSTSLSFTVTGPRSPTQPLTGVDLYRHLAGGPGSVNAQRPEWLLRRWNHHGHGWIPAP